MKNLIYFLLMWLSATAYAQVTGNAQLMGETDHSGIKVLFTAVSPTAKTDSTITDVNGGYTKSLMAGTYSVKFQKSGFYDSTYKQNVFVNGEVKLDTLELISTKIVYLLGEKNGVLDSNYIYIVKGSFGGELIINPGVKLLIDKAIDTNSVIYINAQFKGTRDAFIKIESSYINQKLAINGSIDYLITDCNIVETGGLEVRNSILNKVVINTIYGDYYISNNNIKYLRIAPSKIYSHPHVRVFVTCNKIGVFYENLFNEENLAINTFIFRDNYVYDSLNFSYFKLFRGVYGGAPQTILPNFVLQNNVFASKKTTIMFGSNSSNNYPVKTQFLNNTFLSDSVEFIFNSLDSLVMENNIFGNVKLSKYTPVKFFKILKNQLSVNSSNFQFPGLGIPIAKNNQGSNIDTYLNVIEDPQFSRAPLLASTSPMIGAGVNGTNIGFDPYGTCLETYFAGGGNPNHNKGDTLSISGKIKVSGANVISATVKAVNVLTHREFIANADITGNFLIDSLPLGKYYIETTPLADLANSYLTTYYPRRATLQQADTINIQGKIIDMQIYLVSKTTVGLYDEELVSKIYPNPFKDQLIVENKSNEHFTVSDVSGRVMFAGQQMSEPINTQAWQSGMYFVKINNQVLKFVKE